MLTTSINRWTFTASGATGNFTIPAPVFDASALACYAVNQSTNATYVPTYTVTLADDRSGATVVVSAGLTSGDEVIVYRAPKLTQAQSLNPSGPFPAKVVERQVDRAFVDIGALWEMVRRSIRLPLADDDAAPELDVKALRAGKIVGFDGLGGLTLLANVTLEGVVAVSGYMQGLLTSANAAATRTTLGFSTFFQTLIGAADDAALRALADLVTPGAPTGRLTLQSGAAVMTANQTGKTTLYYTPHAGVARAPVWDGTRFLTYDFAELSNDLTASATNKAGPAAAGPYQVLDAFVWNDSGTVRLTRGPKWKKSASVTTTIATPAVLGWVGHSLYDGATFRFTATTGALPTGFALNTDYFVTKIDADSFKLSTTLANQVAGTFIATSGTQSGTHTGENYTVARGTGAGTAELERLNGVWVNKYDITNGPLARKGTYVGCIVTDGSSQANWHTGGIGAGGTAALLGVWNAYNRVKVSGMVGDSTDSWAYATAATRPAKGSSTARVWCLYGLQEDSFAADYRALRNDGSPSNEGYCGVLYNSTSSFSGRLGYFGSTSVSLTGSGDHQVQHFGWGFFSAGERGNGTGTGTWYGDNGAPTTYQSGLRYDGNC